MTNIYMENKTIYLDTGAFLSRFLKNDNCHKKALKKWEQIKKSKYKCVTSNFILDETFTLLGRWTDYKFAAEKANIIYSSNIIEILRPEYDDELAAIKLFQKFSDQKVSYKDCISFILMKRMKIKYVFSFDRHFTLAGFKLY